MSEDHKIQWNINRNSYANINRNSYVFFQENAFEYAACEISAILSRYQCGCTNFTSNNNVVTDAYKQNGAEAHIADGIFKRVSLNENFEL